MDLQEGVVYGPVNSRRLGRSLGVNVLPTRSKLCNFNCPYCQYGWTHLSAQAIPAETWPRVREIAHAVETALQSLRAGGETIDRVTLAGHGEPTLHPAFGEVVARLRELRDREAPDVPIAVLSNSSTVDQAAIRSGLALLDERYMKLDAGDPAIWRRLSGSSLSFLKILDGLRRLPGVTIQTMFVRDRRERFDNWGDAAVGRWLDAIAMIQPQAVHVYTIDRAPAFPTLYPVSASQLERIADRVRARGIAAEAFA